MTGADGGSVTDVAMVSEGVGACGESVGSELDPFEESAPVDGTTTGRDSGTVGRAGSVGAWVGSVEGLVRLCRDSPAEGCWVGSETVVEERSGRPVAGVLGSVEVEPVSEPVVESEPPWVDPSLVDPAESVLPRGERRVGVCGFAGVPEPEVSEEVPVEPLEPVVSATATGSVTTAAPTPSATARAPTRPTKAEKLPGAGLGGSRRGGSMS